MPIAVPAEVAELVARDNQGRVLWFGVPPVDVVGWSGGEGVRGHSLEYLAKKRKKEENDEPMKDVQVTETSEERGFKKRATELLVKALGMIGN
jgi:chromatin structure-remodeling complex subunit RSC1/2